MFKLKNLMLGGLFALSMLLSFGSLTFADSYDNLIYDVDINFNCGPTQCESWEDDQGEIHYDCMDFYCATNLPNSAYGMSVDSIEVYTILHQFLNIPFEDFGDYKVCMNWKSLETYGIKGLYQSYQPDLVPSLTSGFPIVGTSYCTELAGKDTIYLNGGIREATGPSMFLSGVENIKIYSNENHYSSDVSYEFTDVSAGFRIPLGSLKPSSVDIQIVDGGPISFNYSYSAWRYPTINSSCSLINQKYVCNDSDYLNFVYGFQPAFDLVINSVGSESNKILVTVKGVQRKSEESITSSIMNSNSGLSGFGVAVVGDGENSLFGSITKILQNYTGSLASYIPTILIFLISIYVIVVFWRIIRNRAINIFGLYDSRYNKNPVKFDDETWYYNYDGDSYQGLVDKYNSNKEKAYQDFMHFESGAGVSYDTARKWWDQDRRDGISYYDSVESAYYDRKKSY